MGTKELWAKMRPTALLFAVIMAVLVWALIGKVLGGALGAAAFGDAGQAASIITATLIVVGTAVGSLGSALLKLSEDGPPTQVPESSHQALIEVVSAQQAALPVNGQLVENVQGHRGREGLGESG